MAAVVACAGGVGVATSRAAAAHTAVTPTVILVSASEFHYKLSKTFITKPGTVIFKIKNTGKVAHNFVILSGINKTTPLIRKGKTASLKVVFKKKGKYTYECTVGEHAERGHDREVPRQVIRGRLQMSRFGRVSALAVLAACAFAAASPSVSASQADDDRAGRDLQGPR